MASEVAVVPRKIGRPGHLTPEAHEAFMIELRKGIAVSHAARLAGLKPTVVNGWIQRGRGRIPERPASPEYVRFVADIEDARAHLVSDLSTYVLEGAKKDPLLALRLLDRIDPQWLHSMVERRDADDDDPDDRAFLRPGGGGAVALSPVEDEPEPDRDHVQVTERVRTISIPASRLAEFTRSLRGKDTHDPSDRLSRFREAEGDLPPT